MPWNSARSRFASCERLGGAVSGTAEYLLGAQDPELARLRLQHEIWRGPMIELMDAAGFGPGQRLLDLGCGPGWSSLELARRVGAGGSVLARDSVRRMTDATAALARAEGIAHLTTDCADAAAPLPPASLDGAYARWIFCWLPDPLPALRAVARALKPGGRLAIADYLCYAPELRLQPSGPAFQRGLEAVEASWRASGGDPEIGEKLPRLLEEAGLRVVHRRELRRAGGPQDHLWQWPTSFFPLFVPRLVNDGWLTVREAEDFLAEWQEARKHPDCMFQAPPMLDLVAQSEGVS
jgi:SAM-dependent methyltransferase